MALFKKNGVIIQLPQRMVDVVALKQQLLSQYDLLQARIKELRQAAEKEVCSFLVILLIAFISQRP